jgi:hypothetical protein
MKKLNDAIGRVGMSKRRAETPGQERYFSETLAYLQELRRTRTMLKLWSRQHTLSPTIKQWLQRETEDFVTAIGEEE